ncbi:hypothetical protein D9611_013238 [Ephemerocybe angulata]|uniref:Uncharacterized protein n=1 Tax=Ephemerocybe angulata TaxID=980116 RepID=A0A8H5CCC9_9AGAR|nr:hypothetical protein D9611_013238 [Tulosesus angulatus]
MLIQFLHLLSGFASLVPPLLVNVLYLLGFAAAFTCLMLDFVLPIAGNILEAAQIRLFQQAHNIPGERLVPRGRRISLVMTG